MVVSRGRAASPFYFIKVPVVAGQRIVWGLERGKRMTEVKTETLLSLFQVSR